MRGSWRPTTLEKYQTQIEMHLKPHLGDVDVRAIDGPMLQRLIAALAPRSPRTIRVTITVLKAILSWGHRHGRIRTLRDLTVKLPAVGRPDMDPLTIDQIALALDNAFEWHALIMWACSPGCVRVRSWLRSGNT
jgi:hypothetical protein